MSKDKEKQKDLEKKALKKAKKEEKEQKKSGRRLCKWDKDEIDKDLDKLKELVVPARFICRRCGRVAKESGSLCKPVTL